MPCGECLPLAATLGYPGPLPVDIVQSQPVRSPVLTLVPGHRQPPGRLQSLELLLARDLGQLTALGVAGLSRLPVG